MNRLHSQSGFALLITLVVVSVVLAIGLSLMQITLKQLQLTITARDSEVAFYAANAGIECLQAERLRIDPFVSIPITKTFYCVQSGQAVTYDSYNPNNASARTHLYEHDFDWSTSLPGGIVVDLCTEVKMFLLDARDGTYTQSFSDLGLEEKECEDGNICTVMFSTGYNKACGDFGGLQTVQRELTIEG